MNNPHASGLRSQRYHETLTLDVELAPILEEKWRGSISCFEYSLRIPGEEVVQACQRWLKSLSHGLLKRTAFTKKPTRFSLFTDKICKESLRRLELKWMGLRLKPLLLQLSQAPALNEEKESDEWKEIENNVGYYGQETITSFFHVGFC